MSTVAVADGEYELQLSDALLSILKGDGGVEAPLVEASELLSIRYATRPTELDDMSPLELVLREEKEPTTFQLRGEGTDPHESLTFDGEVVTGATGPRDVECVLIFNESTLCFELQKMGSLLKTTNMKKTPKRSSSEQQQQPKRQRKEPSIFQPKPKPKSARASTPSSRRPKSANTNLSDDDVPLSKLPKRSASTRPSAPSPLISSYNNNSSLVEESSLKPSKSIPTSAKPGAKKSEITRATTPLVQDFEPSSLVSSPQYLSQEDKSTRHQVASKKPPSTIATPTITQPSHINDYDEDEDDFGALVNELEEELLSDDVITIDEGNSNKSDHNSSATSLSVGSSSSQPRRPINFRAMAGVKNNDDDDVSSSSEEE